MDVEFFANDDDAAATVDFESSAANDNDILNDDADRFDEFDNVLGDAQKFTEVRTKDWKKRSHSQIPKVTFDVARRQVWEHNKKEIKFFMEQSG